MSAGFDRSRFDPEVLADLERIDLIAQVIADGVRQGLRRSLRPGFSSEFSDFKPYAAGDDLRFLDWRLYARTDRLFVKRFEAETDLEVNLLLDATASMAWRWRDAITKLEYAANLLAALACLHVRQQDRVGLLADDGGELRHLPPRCKRSQLEQIFALLSEVKPGANTSLPRLAREVTAAKRHRGVIVICSDLEEEEERLEEALELLAATGDDLYLFHLLDRAEVELPFHHATHLEDAETGEVLRVDMARLRRGHRREVERFRAGWRERCRRFGVDYHAADSGCSYVDVICGMVESQRR